VSLATLGRSVDIRFGEILAAMVAAVLDADVEPPDRRRLRRPAPRVREDRPARSASRTGRKPR
jgi:hypothetical protein